ncbi:hypothetical protein ABTZ03_05965 [Kitasatospora sp. NPDC096077]|uniref:hypothetical protein n=1 Tax=Kitasatospora sp. NPDC096077 TaxID=3155544 RepID=UPI00331DF821
MRIWRRFTRTSSSAPRKSPSRPTEDTADRRLTGFIETYLHVEVAYGTLARLKSTVRASSWCEDVERSLARTIAERSMTPGEYCDLTFIEFETDEEMYAYLEKLHAFLFLDQGELPLPPD